jgi:hypothetical protein
MHVIRVLGGENTDLTPDRMLVDVRNGRMVDVECGCGAYALRPAPASEPHLMGWGKLDGPYVIGQPENAAWTVMIPVRELERIGVSVPTA